jgi:hypothetical protein
MKLELMGHLNKRNKFSKEVFPNPMIFLLILDELENLGLGANEHKSMKSNGLEPWIHYKVRDR